MDDKNRVIFEGMATLVMQVNNRPVTSVLDVYVTVRVEMVDDVLCRWYGTISHLLASGGDTSQAIPTSGPWSLCFSDGRMGVVDIPNPVVSGEKIEFLGSGLPPGFEPLYTRAVLPPEYLTQMSSAVDIKDLVDGAFPKTTQWRAHAGRVLFTFGFIGMILSVWETDPDQSRLVWSSVFLWLASLIMFGAQTTLDRKVREMTDHQIQMKTVDFKRSQEERERGGKD